MRSIASYRAGPLSRIAQKTVIGTPLLGREGSTQFAQDLPDHCDSSFACRLCRFITSVTTPVGPAAFPIFNPLIAAATSSSKISQQGPSPQDDPNHHPSHFQHLGASPYTTSIYPSFRKHQTQRFRFFIQHTLITSLPSLAICLAILEPFFLPNSL